MATPEEQRIAQELLRALQQNGQVQISGQTTRVQLDGGEVVSLGPGQPVELRRQVVRDRRRRASEIAEEPVLPIKALLYRFTPDGGTEFFIGCDRSQPKRILQLPPDRVSLRFGQAAIRSIGPRLNDWMVTIGATNTSNNESELYLITPRSSHIVTQPEEDFGFRFACYGSWARGISAFSRSLTESETISVGYFIDGSIGSSAVSRGGRVESSTGAILLSVEDAYWRSPVQSVSFTASSVAAPSTFGNAPPGISIGCMWNPVDNSFIGQGGLLSIFPSDGFVQRTYAGAVVNSQLYPDFTFFEGRAVGSGNIVGDSFYLVNGISTASELPGEPGRIQEVPIERFRFAGGIDFQEFSAQYYGFTDLNAREPLRNISATYYPPSNSL